MKGWSELEYLVIASYKTADFELPTNYFAVTH